MTLETRTIQSDETRLPSSKNKSPSSQIEKEMYTHKEVLEYLIIEPFTLEEALISLEISEQEFQDQLDSRGFCLKEDFNRNGKFPVEWIDALDTGHWMID